jgi:hypothetical protein
MMTEKFFGLMIKTGYSASKSLPCHHLKGDHQRDAGQRGSDQCGQ